MTNFETQPISVNASPTPAQISAGFRQLVISLGSILATVGFTDLGTKVGQLQAYAGIAGAVIAFIWGQVSTHVHAKKAATMAKELPNSIAVLK